MYTFSNQHDDLESSIQNLIERMIEKGFLPSGLNQEQKNDLISKVAEGLRAAYDNNVPTEIFTNPAQQNSLMCLIKCALTENNLLTNPAEKHPSLTATFDSKALAKALFAPENQEQAKKQISAFVLTLLPPGPDAKKLADKTAENTIKQNKIFDNDTKQYDEEANKMMDYVLAQFAATKEMNFAQLFGIGFGGKAYIIYVEFGNAGAFPDPITYSSTRAPGALNMDQDITNPTVNPQTRSDIANKLEDIGGIQSGLAQDMMRSNLAPRSAPTPIPGASG